MSQISPRPIACELDAMTPAQRERYDTVRARMETLNDGIEDRADGYALRFSDTSETLLLLAEFITYERLCCPFLHFRLDVQPAEPIRLTLSGGEGVKDFLAGEFGFTS